MAVSTRFCSLVGTSVRNSYRGCVSKCTAEAARLDTHGARPMSVELIVVAVTPLQARTPTRGVQLRESEGPDVQLGPPPGTRLPILTWTD
ncbi:hypothetical protein SCLCIDRAFT_1209239 [Scleroderma citrinum Foug A]|uniref:Uncharacterized protein n=1 Tax=Scleroderma citrinum Foug A TaxID=1036808 RepID=A0A0C3ATY9_9AGAM|nr:hypothetical protein SCLCIDRAFT_1209239 [Scleroderma citrinum Foug A]